MTWVAVAIGGSAVVGGVVSNQASKKAAGASKDASDASIRATKEASEQARADINRLVPGARQSQGLGFQQALDTFSQSMPQQANVFQQGNMGAQQALLAGLPQMNNAILGGPIDYSAFQPQQLNYNMDFTQGNQAVGYTTPEQQSANVQIETAQYPQPPQALASMLSGGNNFNPFGRRGMYRGRL